MPVVPFTPQPSAPIPQAPPPDPVYVAMASALTKADAQIQKVSESEVPTVKTEDGVEFHAYTYGADENWDMELSPDMFYNRVKQYGSAWGVKEPPGSYVSDDDIKAQPKFKELIDKAPDQNIEVRRLKKGYHLVPKNDLVS